MPASAASPCSVFEISFQSTILMMWLAAADIASVTGSIRRNIHRHRVHHRGIMMPWRKSYLPSGGDNRFFAILLTRTRKGHRHTKSPITSSSADRLSLWFGQPLRAVNLHQRRLDSDCCVTNPNQLGQNIKAVLTLLASHFLDVAAGIVQELARLITGSEGAQNVFGRSLQPVYIRK
jgi:hypothetical protein